MIGALIGLEREYYQQKEDSPDFAGIRTFSLIALLGAVTAYLIDDFGVILMALALGGLILMSTVSYFSAILLEIQQTRTAVIQILPFAGLYWFNRITYKKIQVIT